MKSFNLPTLIGNPADTTLTFAKLIFGGVLDCFPKLKFLLAHAGGFLPYTSANPARNKHLDRRKEEYLQRNRSQASRYQVLTMCEF